MRRDLVLDRLRMMIVLGALAPGEVIRDVELARRLGVSNTPVREALVHLSHEGLVEMPPYRTKRVAPLDIPAVLGDLGVLRILAKAGYEMGIPRITDDAVARMKISLDLSKAAIDHHDREVEFRTSVDFHDEILLASGNAKLSQMARALQMALQRPIHLTALYETARGFARMKRIYDAVAARDTSLAVVELMHGHDVLAKAIRQLQSPAALTRAIEKGVRHADPAMPEAIPEMDLMGDRHQETARTETEEKPKGGRRPRRAAPR